MGRYLTDIQMEPTLSETLVDNELAAASLNEDSRQAQATYSWSMTRQATTQAFAVRAEGSESSILAGDLRFEVLTDPISFELTRGVTVTVHEYITMDSTDSVTTASLRRMVTATIQQAIIENCYRLPT